jgi:hypothetical protein
MWGVTWWACIQNVVTWYMRNMGNNKGTGTVSTNLQHKGIFWNSVTFGSFATMG